MKPLYLILYIAILLLYPLYGQGQEHLGKSADEIRMFISSHTSDPSFSQEEKGDTLRFTCQEQDDLGRLFHVSYAFVLKDNKCRSYRKQFPVHEFWIRRLIDEIDMQGGMGEGDPLPMGDEELCPIYRFEGYTLRISVDREKLSCIYEEQKTPPHSFAAELTTKSIVFMLPLPI